MASDNIRLFGNIMLGGRGGVNMGQLKIHPGGFLWKKSGGGKVVELPQKDVSGLSWTRIPRGYQLGVHLKAGSSVKFNGFKEQDVSSLSGFMSSNMGIVPEDKPLSISGRNWGDTELDGNVLAFSVDGKQAFQVSLADISQSQLQGKNDVVLEFHVDDTAGANEKDCLTEMSFHIPSTNTTFVGDENNPPAQVFHDKILSMADVGPSTAEAVAWFKEVTILTPRGRYSVELHFSFLRMQGQANDFKIQYSSVVRLFVLPKSHQPHTFVVITLDPPIRKGQTFYPHIVVQFPTEETTQCDLTISQDLLNTKYKDRLQASYTGLAFEVFAQILHGLSGAKVTRPGTFRNRQNGYAVRAFLKAEDGVLYPLEKAFFFLPKPPTLILHDEIDHVEFERHGAGGTSSMSAAHYFDLIIRLRNEQEHQFRNIQRNEYHNLFDFILSKNLKIANLGEIHGPSGVAAALERSVDETVDPHLERIKSAREGEDGLDTDEEDEDFVAEKDDAGSPTDESSEGEGSSDASINVVEGKEKAVMKEKRKEAGVKEKKGMVVAMKKVKKKKTEEAAALPKATKKTKTTKRNGDEEDGDVKKKTKRRKKDPNAPKRAMTAFMYFSQAQREVLKKTDPALSFLDRSKVIGERWKKMSDEEKQQYEARAKLDKARYSQQMADYRGEPQATASGGRTASDDASSPSD